MRGSSRTNTFALRRNISASMASIGRAQPRRSDDGESMWTSGLSKRVPAGRATLKRNPAF